MDGSGSQRRGGGATAEPVAVLEAAIQRMVQDAKSKALAKAASAAAPFLPAPAFQGRRRGYAFTTRAQGTGYYLDPHQPPPSADEEGGGPEDEDKGEDDEAAPAQAEQLDPEELLRRAEEDAGEVGGPGSPAAW
ncbi:hypothetical protein MNEG_11903 [Monoraphidium neglectum]|uniref:Uncharacterized protein n=1 Tax=Monoraphidium neglectum TaxID=145388 RepID=A0A0D2MMS5_9CHLO|nr:hypothetical protein MNEG_11903 [Monoraphidium neglectum]KIY96060.1 hypothetical protein MNEG_11903 [Monoraphidium neglectum]|eukprot:XP_013895080.1 hypothetical protein MNEG_11903 [Monoraphidium neglectum]